MSLSDIAARDIQRKLGEDQGHVGVWHNVVLKNMLERA